MHSQHPMTPQAEPSGLGASKPNEYSALRAANAKRVVGQSAGLIVLFNLGTRESEAALFEGHSTSTAIFRQLAIG